MAPHSAGQGEMVPSGWPASHPLMWAVGSVVPAILMILLLLLCFPFGSADGAWPVLRASSIHITMQMGSVRIQIKRHLDLDPRSKRQLSPKTHKRDADTSELVSMTKLGDQAVPEEKSLLVETSKTGRPLSSNQAKKETNGFSAGFQHKNATSPKDGCTASPEEQRLEKSGKLDSDHLGVLSPQPSCPDVPSPKPMQFRKLPLTPKEVHISKMGSQNQIVDSQVYESIGGEKGRELCPCAEPVTVEGCSPSAGLSCAAAGDTSIESSGKDARPTQSTGIPLLGTTVLPSSETLQEPRSENTVAFSPNSEPERRISAMYARVCKRPKEAKDLQPKSQDKAIEQEEEEEPPPIPEKHFENIYESLNLEVQGDEVSNTMTPPEA